MLQTQLTPLANGWSDWSVSWSYRNCNLILSVIRQIGDCPIVTYLADCIQQTIIMCLAIANTTFYITLFKSVNFTVAQQIEEF